MTRPDPQFSVLTFNLLAPCYKRLFSPSGQELRDRERDFYHLWNDRLESILSLLNSVTPPPQIIALQEVWFHPPFLRRLNAAFSDHYHIFFARRPDAKDDGLATLIRKDCGFFVQPSHVASFPLSCTDRLGLAVRLTLTPLTPNRSNTTLLIVNTHLTFPHSTALRRVRDKQVQVLTSFVSSFVASNVGPVSSLVLGDFNSDMHSGVCLRMLDAHFLNCYTSLNGPAAHPTTHYNHKQQNVFVDHVFLRNDPAPSSTPLQKRNRSHDDACKRSRSPSIIDSTHVFAQYAVDSNSSQTLPPAEPLDRFPRVPHIHPVASTIYPEHISTELWPHSYQVSDHRPVCISFNLASGQDKISQVSPA